MTTRLGTGSRREHQAAYVDAGTRRRGDRLIKRQFLMRTMGSGLFAVALRADRVIE
jgi:hypothetical protein